MYAVTEQVRAPRGAATRAGGTCGARSRLLERRFVCAPSAWCFTQHACERLARSNSRDHTPPPPSTHDSPRLARSSAWSKPTSTCWSRSGAQERRAPGQQRRGHHRRPAGSHRLPRRRCSGVAAVAAAAWPRGAGAPTTTTATTMTTSTAGLAAAVPAVAVAPATGIRFTAGSHLARAAHKASTRSALAPSCGRRARRQRLHAGRRQKPKRRQRRLEGSPRCPLAVAAHQQRPGTPSHRRHHHLRSRQRRRRSQWTGSLPGESHSPHARQR